MLLVEARVGPSSIHGLGLISQQAVAAGGAISKFAPELDLTLSQEQLDALPPAAGRSYRYYSFRHVHSERYVLSFDDDRFMNHANDPNTDGRRALQPIAPGDELTYDYRRWDLDCEWKLAATPGSFDQTLTRGDAAARLAVLRVVARVGLRDSSLVTQIAANLSDPGHKVRYYAAKALAKLGRAAAPTAEALGAALQDVDPEVRYYVAKSLSKVGPSAARVLPELKAAMNTSDEKVRGWCSQALRNITPSDAEAIAGPPTADGLLTRGSGHTREL